MTIIMIPTKVLKKVNAKFIGSSFSQKDGISAPIASLVIPADFPRFRRNYSPTEFLRYICRHPTNVTKKVGRENFNYKNLFHRSSSKSRSLLGLISWMLAKNLIFDFYESAICFYHSFHWFSFFSPKNLRT